MKRNYSGINETYCNWVDNAINYANRGFENGLNLVGIESHKGVGRIFCEILDYVLMAIGVANHKYKLIRQRRKLKKGGLERLDNTTLPLNGKIKLDDLQKIIKGK